LVKINNFKLKFQVLTKQNPNFNKLTWALSVRFAHEHK